MDVLYKLVSRSSSGCTAVRSNPSSKQTSASQVAFPKHTHQSLIFIFCLRFDQKKKKKHFLPVAHKSEGYLLISLPTQLWSSIRHQFASSSWRHAVSYLYWYIRGSVSGMIIMPLSCIVSPAHLDCTSATHCCRPDAQPVVQPEVRLAVVQ